MINDDYKIPFYHVVRHLLKQKGLNSAREIEQVTGVPEGTLKPFFSGKTKYLQLPNMVAISDYLGINIGDILEMARQGVLDPDMMERKVAGSRAIVARNAEAMGPAASLLKLLRTQTQELMTHMASAVRIYGSIDEFKRGAQPIQYRHTNPPKYGGKELTGFINRHGGCDPEILVGDIVVVDVDIKNPQNNDFVYLQYKGKDTCGRFFIDEAPHGGKLYKIKTDRRKDSYIYVDDQAIQDIMVIVSLVREFQRTTTKLALVEPLLPAPAE